jgi:hypothetical protein
MAKGKGGKFVYDRQDQQISQFQKDIRQLENRDWLTATEVAVENGRKAKRTTPNTETRTTHYNPNNPLNGSSSWTKEQWNYYKQTGKSPIKK